MRLTLAALLLLFTACAARYRTSPLRHGMKRALLFALVWMSAAAAFAQRLPHVDFETYTSRSGEHALTVDPTDRMGRGAANYRLTSRGAEKWRAELPFTLLEAVVTEEGCVCGYAYEESIAGISRKGFDAPPGKLHLVILDPEGKLRVNEEIARRRNGEIHGLPQPVVGWITVVPEADLCAFQLERSEAGGDRWTYRLSTGEKRERFDIRKRAWVSNRANCVAETAVPGTGLSLVHWVEPNDADDFDTAVFTLLNADGGPVWSQVWSDDYTGLEERSDPRRLIYEKGAILDASKPGAFDLWHVAKSERVAFSVEASALEPTGWRVHETRRVPYELPPETKPAVPSGPPLTKLGEVPLSDRPYTGPVRGLHTVRLDDRGRIGFYRRDPGNRITFVLLEASGELSAELPLPYLPDDSMRRIAWITGSRWLVADSKVAPGARTRAWWLDLEQRALAPLEHFDCPELRALRPDGAGGFVALADTVAEFPRITSLIAYDAAGTQRWKLDQEYSGNEQSLFSPSDITVTSRGEVAVIDAIRSSVQMFDLNGKFLRRVQLEEAWGRKPGHASRISADVDGGYIIVDSSGPIPYVRMNADGTVRGEIKPRFADGRSISPLEAVLAVAPDGTWWLSDSRLLMRLTSEGVVEQTFGAAPNDEHLGEIGAAIADSRGTLYVADAQTGIVHVFGPDGQKLRRCKTGGRGIERLALGTDGALLVAHRGKDEQRIAWHRFLPDGTQDRLESLKPGPNISIAVPQPGGERWLFASAETVWLAEKDGAITRKLDRHADRAWLRGIEDVEPAPDGSFALLGGAMLEGRNTFKISIYAADGAPIRSFAVPCWYASVHGFDGTRLVVSTDDGEVRIYTADGTLSSQLRHGLEHAGRAFLAQQGRELWVLDSVEHLIHRFAMP